MLGFAVGLLAVKGAVKGLRVVPEPVLPLRHGRSRCAVVKLCAAVGPVQHATLNRRVRTTAADTEDQTFNWNKQVLPGGLHNNEP